MGNLRAYLHRYRVKPACMAILAVWAVVPAGAQLPLIREAEACTFTCREGMALQENIWARDGKLTPAFWGQAVGDSLTWNLTLKQAHSGLRFGLRYSYAGPSFEAHFPWNKERNLHLLVDGRKPLVLHVPSTGSWDRFATVSVPLPRLGAGSHTLKVVSPAQYTTTNIDTLLVFSGTADKLPAPLPGTTIAISPSRHFELNATPNAVLKMTTDRVFRDFDRIHAYYKDYMGWAPEGTIPINLIESAKWPDPGATAFQNNGGVFFRAEAMAAEQGNWLHEMTHMFYLGHFPRWFDEPSVRTLTILVWAPSLYPNGVDARTDAAGRRELEEGKAVWRNPDASYDNLNPILNALVARYGEDLFRRFFHACVNAGKKGGLDFRPGRWLTKADILKYMGIAAGEDVEPLFRRWKGFDSAE